MVSPTKKLTDSYISHGPYHVYEEIDGQWIEQGHSKDFGDSANYGRILKRQHGNRVKIVCETSGQVDFMK